MLGAANERTPKSATNDLSADLRAGDTPARPEEFEETVTRIAEGEDSAETEVIEDFSGDIAAVSSDEEGRAPSPERETDLIDGAVEAGASVHLVAQAEQPVPADTGEARSDEPQESAPTDSSPDSIRTAPDSSHGEIPQAATTSAQVQKSDVMLGGTNAVRAPDGSVPKGEADTVLQTGTGAIPKSEVVSETAMRSDVLNDQKVRNSTSILLDAHREVSRQQPATTRAQADVAQVTLTKPELMKQGQPVTAELQGTPVRLREMPQVAPAVAMAPTVRPQINTADVRVANPAGGVQTTAQSQALVANTVLQSAAAVVTGIAGGGNTPRLGEEVLTQRGAESFALPQMLAEASVRSGASSFRAETPRHVAQQLAEAVATAGKRNVDVSLNPRELGHVNMRVTTTDVGVTVVINAERPETEDLMRRHIQDLAREFKDMGFSDISFQFGSDAQTGQSGEGGTSGDAGGAGLKGEGDAVEEGQPDLPLSQHLNIAADGLDMRI